MGKTYSKKTTNKIDSWLKTTDKYDKKIKEIKGKDTYISAGTKIGEYIGWNRKDLNDASCLTKYLKETSAKRLFEKMKNN